MDCKGTSKGVIVSNQLGALITVHKPYSVCVSWALNRTDRVSKHCGIFPFSFPFSTLSAFTEKQGLVLKKGSWRPTQACEGGAKKQRSALIDQVQSGMNNLLLSMIKQLCRKGQRDKSFDPPPRLCVDTWNAAENPFFF